MTRLSNRLGFSLAATCSVLFAFPLAYGQRPTPGRVRVGDEWYSLAEAERRERAEERLTRYVRLRQQKAGSLVGELQLARWCERHGLAEQARAHWLQVLRINARDKRALKALNVQWYRGTLMSSERVDELRALEASVGKQLKESQEKLQNWRRAVVSGDEERRNAALKELRWSSEDILIVAIDQVLLQPTDDTRQTMELQLLGIEMLGELSNSHRVLAWFAASSPVDEVRRAALEQLRRMPLAESVPVLLARMRMPLELGVSTRLQGSRVAVDYSFYREGPGQTEFEKSFTAFRQIQGPQMVQVNSVSVTRSVSSKARTFLVPSS